MIVEIGTSDFRTRAGKEEGLFIEPVKPYFDRLPQCNKLNIAISNYIGSIDVFYIDPEDIEKEGMPDWIRGCNSIGKFHPTVLEYGYSDYIRSHTVEVKRIADVLKENDIITIDFLKIDTEGHDAVILNDYLDTVEFLPYMIQFENNVLSNESEVNNLIFRLKKDYIVEKVKHDIICKRIKLNQKGHKIFHVKETMIYHGQHTSVMNNESRVKCNLSNIPIVAGVATFKGREELLLITYSSIIKQVDELHIYVNDEAKLNKQIRNDKKVTIYRHPAGDLGDSGKFYFDQNRVAYFFTLDDDLIYPKDYVNHMVKKIEQHGRQCVITLHGKIVSGVIRSYYKNDFINYRCLDDVYGDVNVDIPGTGVMAWFSNTINFDLSDFEIKNMADIWAAIKCRKEKVSVICSEHQKGWLRNIDNESTLWKSNKERDKILTDAVKRLVSL